MKKYIPNPVDTEQIQLPKELEYLVEEMAKNEMCIRDRSNVGFRYTSGGYKDGTLS